MGKMSKRKGSGYERQIAKMLDAIWPDGEFKRTPMSGGSELRIGWKLTGDIVTNSPTFDFCVECKKQEAWRLEGFLSRDFIVYKWWKQATEEASVIGKKPMLIFSKNHAPDFVAVKYSHWPIKLPAFFIKTPHFIVFEFGELKGLYEAAISRAQKETEGRRRKKEAG